MQDGIDYTILEARKIKWMNISFANNISLCVVESKHIKLKIKR